MKALHQLKCRRPLITALRAIARGGNRFLAAYLVALIL